MVDISGGFFIQYVPNWLRWLRFSSAHMYAMNGASTIVFSSIHPIRYVKGSALLPWRLTVYLGWGIGNVLVHSQKPPACFYGYASKIRSTLEIFEQYY